jgi:hypothetical protein
MPDSPEIRELGRAARDNRFGEAPLVHKSMRGHTEICDDCFLTASDLSALAKMLIRVSGSQCIF